MNKIMPISEVRSNLPKIVGKLMKSNRDHYIITRSGKPAAVIISSAELETLEILSDKKLMLSLLRAESEERANKLVMEEEIFK